MNPIGPQTLKTNKNKCLFCLVIYPSIWNIALWQVCFHSTQPRSCVFCRSSLTSCWTPWIRTWSSSRCGRGSRSPCTPLTCRQVRLPSACSPCTFSTNMKHVARLSDSQVYISYFYCPTPSRLITPPLCLIGSHHVATQRHSETYVCLFLLGMLLLS